MDKTLKDKFLLITYSIVLFILLLNIQLIGDFFEKFVGVMLPFIIGAIIAFILNVIIKSLEEGILKKVKKGKRAISIISSLIIVFGFVVVLLFILIPQVKNAGVIFIDNLPKYQETIYDVGGKIGLSKEQLKILELDKIKKELSSLLTENSINLINVSFGFASSVIGAITNFFVGLVFAIYVLIDKDKLARQFKKILRRFLDKKKYDRTLELLNLSNNTFTNFIKVQFVEACILGLLCFVGMLAFGLPYAATISVVVGFTALIPIFGAFIGCVIGAFLIFIVSPIQALIFVVFFLILQQIEGNLIYPKVVGGKIGLPSIWVLVGVIAGGAIGGVGGMLIGVPILSVAYALLKDYVNNDKEDKVKEVV